MSLKIVKASDPFTIERLNLCIYAQPGVGKTTLGFTAEDPLCLDFDGGSYRAPNRKDIVRIAQWTDTTMTAQELAPYKTIVVDTAGRAIDSLSADIIRSNTKAGRGDGSLTLQGFGTLKSRFAQWMKTLNQFGKDVVILSHMDEQRSGDDIVERLDVAGGSKGEIYKSVDAMGRIFVRDKKRVLDFSPRENSFGKNPAALGVLEIPDIAQNNHFLADVIAQIKTKLNTQTAEQKTMQQAIEDWCELIRQLHTVEDFNTNLANVKKAPRAVQLFFAQQAKAQGYTYSVKSHLYENPKQQVLVGEVVHA